MWACFVQGYDEFYTGAIAKDITNYFANQEGGLLSMEVGAPKPFRKTALHC